VVAVGEENKTEPVNQKIRKRYAKFNAVSRVSEPTNKFLSSLTLTTCPLSLIAFAVF